MFELVMLIRNFGLPSAIYLNCIFLSLFLCSLLRLLLCLFLRFVSASSAVRIFARFAFLTCSTILSRKFSEPVRVARTVVQPFTACLHTTPTGAWAGHDSCVLVVSC